MRGGADSTLREKLSRREGIDRENEISRTVFCLDNGQDGPMYFTFCSNVLYTLVQKYWDTFLFFFFDPPNTGPLTKFQSCYFLKQFFYFVYAILHVYRINVIHY